MEEQSASRGHDEEAPVLAPLQSEESAPGAEPPVAVSQWHGRTLFGPNRVQITLRPPGSAVRQVLAEVIAGPGYVEMRGEPVTAPLPPPPPVVPELSSFTGPASAMQGSSINLTATLSAPMPSGQSRVISVSGLGLSSVITVGAGERAGSASRLVPASQPPGDVMISASAGGKSLSHTVTIIAFQPAPPPPTPVPEGTLGFVAHDAKSAGTGAQNDPWPIMDALTGRLAAKLAAGGTVWLMPGVYKAPQLDPEGVGYLMTVSGSPARPLLFRAAPGARAIIDGGLAWWGGSHDVWLQDLEFISTEAKPTGTSGSNPSPAGSPRGGIHVYSGGAGNKCINCILGAMNDKQGFGNRQGASIWIPSREFELYGCILCDNGWQGSDRAHGHGAYIQNPPGSYRKYARENIFQHRNTKGFTAGRYQFHIYGESPQLSNVTAEGNVAIGPEPSLFSDGYSSAMSAGHELTGNFFVGGRVQVASSPIAPARISGNTIAGGTLEIVGDGSGQIAEGNLIVPPAARPSLPLVSFRPNRYDANRAHVVVLDWQRVGQASVRLEGWAQNGQAARVMDPTDIYGPAIFSGEVPAAGITLPVSGGAAAFVVVKG